MPARGTDNQWAKLDPDKVRAIRQEYATAREKGATIRKLLIALGNKYNSTPSNIHAIVHVKTWKDVE